MMRKFQNCTICNKVSMVVARCTRCHKSSCENPNCVKAIKETRNCAVPTRLLPEGKERSTIEVAVSPYRA